MKKLNIVITLLFLILTPGILISQTYDLRFIEVLNNGANYDVKIQIQGSVEFKLASSNITFNFNSFGLSNPSLLVAHHFDGIADPGTNYDLMTVTNPNLGVASINIFLSGTRSAFASSVPTNWIDVATLRFTTTNPTLTSGLSFRSLLPSNTVAYSCTGDFGTFQTFLLAVGTWFTLDNPLPVELSSFTAAVNQNKVALKWITKTEVNNYGFNVERSINEGEWNTLGFIEGHGNSNSPKEYSYSDKDLFAGGTKFQYRLKQVDADGQFKYSDIVEVEVVPTQYELSQNYPNPFNPSTSIRFSLPKETQLKINIYNMLGELVETLAEGTYEAGYHKVTFNASSLPSGAYVYRIESSDFVQVRKMVLIK